jgi:Uma2 family endonuclease
VVKLTPVVEGQNLGMLIAEQEFDFGGNAHGPDVAFIGTSKLHLLDRKKRVQRFVPDLAIEIVSENDTFKNLMGKAARYRKYGTREVWVLSPDTRNAFALSDERQVIYHFRVSWSVNKTLVARRKQ